MSVPARPRTMIPVPALPNKRSRGDLSSRRLPSRSRPPTVAPAPPRRLDGHRRRRGHDPNEGALPRTTTRPGRTITMPPSSKCHGESRATQGSACAALALGSHRVGGGGGEHARAEPRRTTPVDERTAEKDAKDLVDEIYESIGHGNTDSLMSLLDEPLDRVRPAQQRRAREPAPTPSSRSARSTEAKKKPRLHSGELAVVASPGGRSAWAFDVVDVDGEPHGGDRRPVERRRLLAASPRPRSRRRRR